MVTALEPGLPDAAADYRWLLDRGYPDQPALAIVGDRYRLSSVGRAMLYRGVYSSTDSERRRKRLVGGTGEAITVDGHNVLFTAWNCLAGRPIVAATDGFIRDIGGTRSRLPHDERFTRVARIFCDTLVTLRPAAVTLLLDEPLPWSREHAAELREIWARVGHSVAHRLEIRTEASVDATVAAAARGVIATSDTAIVDRSTVPVVDLGGLIVRTAFRADPVDLAHLIGGCTG
jgi:hypothetical protein